jgi:predicted DNA-binding transcriptional regulator AlpA
MWWPVSEVYLAVGLRGTTMRADRSQRTTDDSEITILNVKELEAFLKIDQKTIYRYVSLGLIPYVKIQSNIRFVKRQILTWIEEQNYQPDSNGNGKRHH